MANRKLQAEIDRTLKKIYEGITEFDKIMEKISSAPNANLKEKHENDLKREIKKLQRLREQVKTWIGLNEVKNKNPLAEARKKIESEMERYKRYERASKTKEYSDEGLRLRLQQKRARHDRPQALEKWLEDSLHALKTQVTEFEAEIARLEKKQVGNAETEELEEDAMKIANLDERIERHKAHIENFQKILLKWKKKPTKMTRIEALKPIVDEYLDAKGDGDFGEESPAAPTTLYETLNLDGPEQDDADDDADMYDEDDIDGWDEETQDDDVDVGDLDQESEKLLDKSQVEKLVAGEKSENTKEIVATNSKRDSIEEGTARPNGGSTGPSATAITNASTTPTSTNSANTIPTVSQPKPKSQKEKNSSLTDSQTIQGTPTPAQRGKKPSSSQLNTSTTQSQPQQSSALTSAQPAAAISSGTAAPASSSTPAPSSQTPNVSGQASSSISSSQNIPKVQPQVQAVKQGLSSSTSQVPSKAPPGGKLLGQKTPSGLSQSSGTPLTSTPTGTTTTTASTTTAPSSTATTSTASTTVSSTTNSATTSAATTVTSPTTSATTTTGTSVAAPSTSGTAGSATSGTGIAGSGAGSGAGSSEETSTTNSTGSATSTTQPTTTPPTSNSTSPIPGPTAPGNITTNAKQTAPTSSSSQQAAVTDQSVATPPSNPSGIPTLSSLAQKQVYASYSANEPNESSQLASLVASLDAQSNYTEKLKALTQSMHLLPEVEDTVQPKQYHPTNPAYTPDCYPSSPLSYFDDPAMFEKFDTDTLFFIFYYQQGTYQQYLAAKELKRQSWRYHKKYLTWFQRHEEPKEITPDYEQGTYIYFDYETGWCQRKKTEFTFEYRYLEDKDLV